MTHDERRLLVLIARELAGEARQTVADDINKLIKRIQRQTQVREKDKADALKRMLEASNTKGALCKTKPNN